MPRTRCIHGGRRLRRAGGFTLIEAALTTVIVGTGVLAIVAAQQAYHMKNDWAQRTATGLLLANEIRELTLPMPRHDPLTGSETLGPEADEMSVADYDDLDDFAGTDPAVTATGKQPLDKPTVFDPPISALRLPIDDLPGWRQEVRVDAVPPTDVTMQVTNLGSPTLDAPDTLLRLTVDVYYQSPHAADEMVIASLSWLVGAE